MAKQSEEERQNERGQKDYVAGKNNPPNDFLGGHLNSEGAKRNRDAYISGRENAKKQDKG